MDVFNIIDDHVDHTVINQKLAETMEKYDLIDQRVKRIVTDGGSNIKLAVRNSTLPGAWCLCHLMDLTVMHALEDNNQNNRLLVQTIEKAKIIVGFYHKSIVAHKNLKDIQQNDNMINDFIDCHYKLVNFVKTRWNSCHDMIKRMLLLYDNVNKSLISLGKYEMLLSDDEIDLLTGVSLILTPASQYTKMLEADLVPTSHLALPLGKELLETVSEWNPVGEDGYHTFPLSQEVRRSLEFFKTQLQSNLQNRLRPVFDEEFYRISAFFSPTTKDLTFLTLQQITQVKRSIFSLMRDNTMGSSNENSQPVPILQQQERTSIRTSLTGKFSTSSISSGNNSTINANDRFRREIERYCSSIVNPEHLQLHSDPLKYWASQEIRNAFPNLFLLAMEYLHIPMSSAASERVFSAMERTVTDLRNRLKPETASTLVFLKSHKDKW